MTTRTAFLILAFAAATAVAGPLNLSLDGPAGSRWTLEGSDRFRGEFVDWFDAGPTSPVKNHRYDFLANRFQVGVRVTRDPFEAFVQFQNTVIGNVPKDAPGPGGLYFANTKRDTQVGDWVRQAWIKGTQPIGPMRFSLILGRQLYRDGGETTSPTPSLDWLKKNRIAERLIGPFDYSHNGRSFDGAVVKGDHPIFDVTGFALRPTSGGYEVDGGRHIQGIDLAGASVTLKDRPGFDRSEARLFWIYAADHRPEDGDVLVVDNRAAGAIAADHRALNIHTIGADALHVEPLGPGQADVLGWAAGQVGDWQSQDHRAWAYAFEGGYQFIGCWAKPWLRGGIFRSSGDANPKDGTHETFYQILPTARQYAQVPFYNLMNQQDTFFQMILQPLERLNVRSEFHWLRATESKDLFYSGSGATKNDFFGFAGAPTGGHRDIGYLADVAFGVKATDWLSFYAYYGHVFGGDVVSTVFKQSSDLDYGYVEGTFSF